MANKARGAAEHGIPETIDWEWVRGQIMTKERIRAGGDPGSKEPLLAAVDECLRIARHLAKPRIASAKKSVVETAKDGITLEGSLSFSGRTVFSNVRGSSDAHLFLVTLGPDLEETATMLMESGEQLHGYLLDRIGSFAVESLAGNFEEELRKRYRAGNKSVSMRISPGYCDWPIEEQRKLEKAVDFSRAGVRLTESCMMIPKKSISGLVGVGPKDLFSASRSQCDICTIKNCDYKRTASVGSKA